MGMMITGPTLAIGSAGASPRQKSSGTGVATYRDEKNGDRVMVCSLPKSKVGGLCSFSYKTITPRASTLQQQVHLIKGRILSVKNSALPPKEKARRMAALRCELRYASDKLACEMNSTPWNRVVVDAYDD